MIAFALLLVLAQTPQPEPAVIAAAKNAIVRDIDPTLPSVKFEAWIQGLVGTQTVLKWAVTDCGEQTGTPADRGRAFPQCAEVTAKLAGDRLLSLQLLTGTMGQASPVGPLKLFSGAIVERRPKPISWIKTLAEVPALLGRTGSR